MRHGRIVYANDSMAALSQCPVAELVDRPLNALVPSDAIAELTQRTAAAPGVDCHVSLPWGLTPEQRAVPRYAICRLVGDADGTELLTLSLVEPLPPPVVQDGVPQAEGAQLDAAVRQVSHYFANTIQAALMMLGRQHGRPDESTGAVLRDVAHYLGTMSQVFELDTHWPAQALAIRPLIDHLVRTVATPLGLDCTVKCGPLPVTGSQIPREHRFPVSMVLAELLTNAAKHSTDRRALIQVSAPAAALRIVVENVGTLGPPPDKRFGGLEIAQRLLPANGARLRVDQQGDKVVANLELQPPVVA